MVDLTKTDFMTKEQMREAAPAVFTMTPSDEVSKHYTHIPTTKVIDDMELLGWGVVDVKEVKARKAKTRGVQKHMVVFRNPDVVINGVTGPHTINICEGALDSFSFEVSNAVLNGTNVNWEITYSETSGQVSSGCNGLATADLPGGIGSYSGIGNVDSTIYIPTTLPVGQYVYTVTKIVNTDKSCTGHVDGSSSNTQTITINVYPEPEFEVTPDSSEVCENNIAIADLSINVTNAQYCSSPSTLANVGWSISGITDNVVSTGAGGPTITGSGNSTAGPYNTNSAAGLTQGSYSWDATTISTTGLPVTCTNTSSDSVYILTVNPAPDASFTATTLTVCEGDTDSLSISVTNAVLNGNNVTWSFDVSETSGNMTSACIVDAGQNASLARDSSGSGNSTYKYYIPGNLVPGVYTYTISNVITKPIYLEYFCTSDCIKTVYRQAIIENYPRQVLID